MGLSLALRSAKGYFSVISSTATPLFVFLSLCPSLPRAGGVPPFRGLLCTDQCHRHKLRQLTCMFLQGGPGFGMGGPAMGMMGGYGMGHHGKHGKKFRKKQKKAYKKAYKHGHW